MVLIKEGTTFLHVPIFLKREGPGKKSGEVFFNSAMAFNRDIAVLSMAVLRPGSFLDGMAATGAMGVRVGNESLCGNAMRLRLNDPYLKAIRYMVANSRINGLDAEISCLNISKIDEKFDHVDIDPFGSPAPYFNSISLVRRSVSLTATDAPVLCGLYPKKCLLRYGARNIEKGPQRKELGLRILVARSVMEGKRLGLNLHPVLSFYMGHYFRAFLVKGKSADVQVDAVEGIGPIWNGPLHDAKVVEKMIAKSEGLTLEDKGVTKFLKICMEEARVKATSFYYIDELSSLMRTSAPKMDVILDELISSGFPSSRTHFDPKGLRTEATIEDIKKIL